jgi:hypothetical protein
MSVLAAWTLRDIFLLAFFGGWLLISVCNQFVLVNAIVKRRAFPIVKWDIFALIPYWCFWSACPNRDCLLLYRDKLTDGSFTLWRSVWGPSRGPLGWIWNPRIRNWKVIDNWLPALLALAQGEKSANEFFVSRLYVSAAVYISGLKRSDRTDRRQFMVARISGFDSDEPAEILFVSPLFRLNL